MSSPRTLSLGSISCLLAAVIGCQSAHDGDALLAVAQVQMPGASVAIATGRVTDLDLSAGADWRADFSVATESYLQVVVEQRNLDVGIRVVDARDEPIGSVDGTGGIGVDERLAIRLAPGRYGLVLRPRLDGPLKGRVRLRIEALRPFEELDSERLRLIPLGQRAADLDGGSSRTGYKRALQLSRQELVGWRRLDDSRAIIRTLIRIVSLQRELGGLSESIQFGREAVTLSLAAGLDLEEAASRYWLGQSLYRAGEVDLAATEFDLGLAAAERAADPVLLGRILIRQGWMSEDRGDLQAAKQLYQRALDLRRVARDMRGINSAVNNLAGVAKRMGDFSLAVSLYREAIEESRQLGNPYSQLLNTSNLSTLLAARGQWQDALDSLTDGLEIARATDDTRSESVLGTKLAHLLLTLGEPEAARPLLMRSLELDIERHDGSAEAFVLTELAQLERELGNLDESEAWMLRAYELSTRLELSAQREQALRGLAALKREQGRPQLALELLGPIVDAARRANQPIRLAKALKSLGETHLALGETEAALSDLELAREALAGLSVPEIRFDISYLTARAMHDGGSSSAAVSEIQSALKMLEELRLSVDDPDLRATFLSRSREAYDFAVELLLDRHRVLPDQGFDRRAFATLERARARSLVEMLARARSGAEEDLDETLLEAERTALAQVGDARSRLSKAEAEGRTEDLVRLGSELDVVLEQLTRAEEDLRRAEPRYASLRYADNYAVEELQAILEPGVALVEFCLRPARSVAFVVTRDRFEVVELADEATVQTQATRLRQILTSPNRRAYETLLGLARQLGDLVVAPLVESLEGTRHLIVVPDGALAYIPFEALRLRDAAATEDIFLIEKWTVSYAASAGVLRFLTTERQHSGPRSGLVAFADPRPPSPQVRPLGDRASWPEAEWPPLPGARREVATIAASVDGRETSTYIDARASELAFKRDPAVERARWIHLATHARIDRRTPADSAIVMAPSADEDGYLTVREIFALDLEAELVVLSGCETALGRQIRGEGLIGLTRAFLYAGAQGIQVSLWKVSDDATPALMSRFYANLASDMGPAEALRAAKLASLNNPQRAHPFYWAPFVFMGS